MTTDTRSEPFTIEYGDAPELIEDIDSVDRLDAELDRIAHESRAGDLPYLVTLTAPSGRSLAIGVGADSSVLSWSDEDAEHPYFTSRGGSTDTEPVGFSYGGEWTEFPPSAAVPVGVARQAAREFVHTGERPGSVDWHE